MPHCSWSGRVSHCSSLCGADVLPLTDAELDAAFAASFDVGDYAAADVYGAYIRERLASFGGAITGLFGGESFPLYGARLNYSQVDAARSSVSDSAGNVASTLGDTFKFGLGGLAVFALVGIAVYAYFGRK